MQWVYGAYTHITTESFENVRLMVKLIRKSDENRLRYQRIASLDIQHVEAIVSISKHCIMSSTQGNYSQCAYRA